MPVLHQGAYCHCRDIPLVDRGRRGCAVGPAHDIAPADLRPPPPKRIRRETVGSQERPLQLGRLDRALNIGVDLADYIGLLFNIVATPNFVSLQTFNVNLTQVTTIVIVAVGMTYLFVAGELDLSVGSNYGFLVTLMAFFVVLRNVDPWIASLIVIGLGVCIGTLNGLMVTRIGLPSASTTLT